jgi:hypothetical protein
VINEEQRMPDLNLPPNPTGEQLVAAGDPTWDELAAADDPTLDEIVANGLTTDNDNATEQEHNDA